MPTATPTATVRRGELVDKPPRRRAVPKDNDGAAVITYSVKEAIDNLSDTIEDLTKAINADKAVTERRFSLLEQNAMLTESHAKDIEIIQKDFAGFEQRFRDHDRSIFHQQGEVTIAKLQTSVDGLEKAQLTEAAVRTFMEKINDRQEANKKWLIGLFITVVIFVLKDAFPLAVRVVQAIPTPTGTGG